MTVEQPKDIKLEVGDPVTVHQEDTATEFKVVEKRPAKMLFQVGRVVITTQGFTLQPTEKKQP